jgi:hypothetical protein
MGWSVASGRSAAPWSRSSRAEAGSPIEPVEIERIALGDIVAVKVADATMLHLVKAIDPHERRVEISGTSGSPSGWTSFECVYAICTRIQGKAVPACTGRHADASLASLGLFPDG